MSGGQQQQVALGRAIVRDPLASCLTSPVQPRRQDAEPHPLGPASTAQRAQATSVYVTHDQEEAMTLGDRVAVMKDGVMQQLGTPLEVYRAAANLFVAGFIGTP